MDRFGSDKPDLRFELEIQDATEVTRGSEFGVFANAASVRYLVAPKAFSRAELARLEELAKEWGAKGLAYLVVDESGELRSPIAKFLSRAGARALRAEPGSTVLFGAGEPGAVARVLGLLRLHLGKELGLVDESRDEFLWVIDFPLFELDEETGERTFSHHPFTGIAPGHDELLESDPGAALSQAYDLVWNGWELGSGSIRIHRPGRPAARLPRARAERRGGEGEVRVPARRAADGRAAARRVRPGARPVRRAARGGAEHSRGDRVPEGLERR